MSSAKKGRYYYLKTAITLIVAIAVGVTLNYLGSLLNGALSLPLFLDSIGTLIIALVGGFVPCVTVGFLTNIIIGFADPVTTYYCVISVIIAAVASLYAPGIRKLKIGRIIAAVFTFAAIGGIIGAVMTWFIGGRSFGEGAAVDLAANIEKILPIGYFASNIVSAFLIDIADKAIVTALALLIYKLLPKKFTDFFARQSFYRITSPKKASDSRRGKVSLRLKLTLLVLLSTVLVATTAICTSIFQYRNSMIADYENRGRHVAGLISSRLEGKPIEDFAERHSAAAGYETEKNMMAAVSEAATEIKYIYIYRIRENDTEVIFDLDAEDADFAGEIIGHDSSVSKYRSEFLAGDEIPTDITNDEFGWLMSVYKPIRGESGNTVCYVGVDLSMDRLYSAIFSFLSRIISLFLGFMILIGTYALWLAERCIVHPINEIAEVSGKFNFDTEESRKESIARLDALEIDTGDEIENLYIAYDKATATAVHHIDEVQKKNEQITKLQNGLVLVLADMVENRDKNTGDHVRKTAAYTEIILKQMQKDGIYADMINDEYIEEVVSSAPLHDVGKIKVSDTILNKPGKLTDDEFRAMQSHTTSGGEIIDKVIAVVDEDSEYLNEAKNLASYHHEKWNGAGYPTGKSGDAIPLSARVMAVADVFDALVSRRSYKEPFSIEKAFEIIEEGAGSHFDPEIVKAFFNAKDEIIATAEKNLEI